MIGVLTVFGGICVLFTMYIYLHRGDAGSVYKCNGCGKESTKDNMKHYDYEYNYEYRCSKCGKIVIEG